MVNYFVNTYAPYDIIAEANEDITNYKQLQGLNNVDHSQSLLTKALLYGPVHKKSRLKGTFIDFIEDLTLVYSIEYEKLLGEGEGTMPLKARQTCIITDEP